MSGTTASGIGLPFAEAIDFFAQKTNLTTEHWTDVWRGAHSRSFMVAGAASDALVADFQREIEAALRDGTPFADFRKNFDQIVERHGWTHNGKAGWRARVIYETNLSTAYAAGRYAQQTDPDTLAVFPYWQYVHSGAQHPRKQHLAWNGLTLTADDPFWHTHYPPNGWGCGCRVRPLSARNLARMGKDGPDRSPDIKTRPWRNPKTGDLHRVPEGIDPGWDYNPGQSWKTGSPEVPVDARWRAPAPVPPLPELPAQRQRPTPVASPGDDRLTTIQIPGEMPQPGHPIPPPVDLRDTRELERFRLPTQRPATAEELRGWLNAPKGNLTVGEVSPVVQEALGASQRRVQLSAETLAKQGRHHPDLQPEDYQLLRDLLARPDLVLREDTRRLALLRHDGDVWVAAIKSTSDGAENYLLSFRRARAKSIRQLLRKYAHVAGDAAKLLGDM